MKVTVCELRNEPDDLARDWAALVEHCQRERSDLVLLPEMPFYPWPAWTDRVDAAVWRASVEAHDRWIARLGELGAPIVAGTRPVLRKDKPYNEGYIWQAAGGYRAAHLKTYLPNEGYFWEATWYERGPVEFIAAPFEAPGGPARAGFMICTELWFGEHARAYARQGAHMVLCPRATPGSAADKWLAGGRAAAVMSGAYCLSSNRGGVDATGLTWAGAGWAVEPEEGGVLGVTSRAQPFLTVEIDLAAAANAKTTYPRYVKE